MFATPGRILLAGWLVFLIYAYPGYLSPDPIQQLYEARTGYWSDWHPPLMGFLWKFVEHIVPGTFGMLVAQSVAFLFGLAGVLRTVLRPRQAAVVAVAILLFPPVLTTMAVIWKDSQMAGYLLAGTACLLAKRRVAGCTLLWLGSAMRHNAFAATLPIIVLLFEWRPGMPRLKRYAIAVGVWLAITLAASQANKLLTKNPTHPWYQTALHDIVGVLHYGPGHSDATIEKLLPDVLRVHVNVGAEIDLRYVTWTNYWLTHGDDRVFEYPGTDEMRATVRHAWWKLVRHEPLAYLRHRIAVSLDILGASDTPVIGPVWDGYEQGHDTAVWEGIGVTMHHSLWQKRWVHALKSVGQSLLFRAYLYMVVALAMLWLCRRSPPDLALLLSGLCYEGTYFIGAVADARYSHWMISCTVLVFVRTVIMRYRRSSVRPSAPAVM